MYSTMVNTFLVVMSCIFALVTYNVAWKNAAEITPCWDIQEQHGHHCKGSSCQDIGWYNTSSNSNQWQGTSRPGMQRQGVYNALKSCQGIYSQGTSKGRHGFECVIQRIRCQGIRRQGTSCQGINRKGTIWQGTEWDGQEFNDFKPVTWFQTVSIE
ncbi:uncharacterized protein LOC131943372 [Physella acuta]|uniref:uncharacterized protein LOC131943372 n=1 Tax=Physella acuta TaxID=109671 RepID=UPI0027DABE13|nr:uncharacterized protein LOC131943372 [Physella acuta]